MVVFTPNKNGLLVGETTSKKVKTLAMGKTAFQVQVHAVKNSQGKVEMCFSLTNKKGVSTPLLKSISIDDTGYLGATTKRCLCDVAKTKKGELSHVYVNLQTGDISPTFEVAGRGHDHKNDYILDKDGNIKVVRDNLTFADTDYDYIGRPTSTDYKSYTRDAGFVVKYRPTGMYGMVSTFGSGDGVTKVLCPPVFASSKIGHKTISTEKYDFLYEYFTDTQRVLADTCYGLALQQVGAGEEFRVGDNIQHYRANHPLVIAAREKESKRFRAAVEKGEVAPKKKSVIERIKDRKAEIMDSIARDKATRVIKTTTSTTASKHLGDAMLDAYPTRAPMEYRQERRDLFEDDYNEIV